MKVSIEIQFDNCKEEGLQFHDKITLKAVDLKELKLHAPKLLRTLEDLQATIDDMVRNSEAEQ
jgi:hypothetical protein